MAKKTDKKKSRNFKLDEKYGGSLTEARQQEMDAILPGFYTNCNGVILKSRPVKVFIYK